jgi:LPS sulfotransferase NodH
MGLECASTSHGRRRAGALDDGGEHLLAGVAMRPPVFIVGCPRSGTSFIYHLLLSAGGFAEFHTQMNVYDVLEPIYGDLGQLKNKRAAMKEWLGSKAFQSSGLDASEIEAKILAECLGAGDFLRIIMDATAQRQGVDRWIDSTPTNVPHMLRIKRDFPDALFIHIIRDARDVALSLDRHAWSRPLPWDKKNSLLAAGLYWEWIVRKGRRLGSALGSSYIEIRYEELLREPRAALVPLSTFLGCDLDYERIQATHIGSVQNPLTAFTDELRDGSFSPVGRWKQKFPAQQLERFEALVGDYLQELGYELSADRKPARTGATKKRAIYGAYYELKQWAKVNTPLSRWMVNYSAILIDK